MKKCEGIALSVTISLIGFMGLYSRGQQELTDKATKEMYLQRIAEWSKGVQTIFMEDPLSSVISEERLRKIRELNEKLLVPLGPNVLPYLLIVDQVNHIIGSAMYRVSKFLPHNIVLNRKPKNLLSTTEEFPEVTEKNISYDARKIWLFWWLEGQRRTPRWFMERYTKWLIARQQGNTQQAQLMYQKLLNIGIAAIPLWLQKLQAEQDKEVRQAILEALTYLTDGEIKPTMSVQECLSWWQANKEQWTIPFPKSKMDFLKWLEREGWEEPRLVIPVVLTISRLENEAAIDALLRFLKHPNPLARAISLEQIQKLFGEQLPKEYTLGVGTDEWERYRDLLELGKDNLVRKRIRETQERVKDLKGAEKVMEELSDWWARNRGKLTIYWQRAWASPLPF